MKIPIVCMVLCATLATGCVPDNAVRTPEEEAQRQARSREINTYVRSSGAPAGMHSRISNDIQRNLERRIAANSRVQADDPNQLYYDGTPQNRKTEIWIEDYLEDMNIPRHEWNWHKKRIRQDATLMKKIINNTY